MTKRSTISSTAEDAEFHKKNFAIFCAHERDTGGPDPHLEMVRWMADQVELTDEMKAWRAICYTMPYTISGGMVLWTRFPHPGMVVDHPRQTLAYITEHWGSVMKLTRRERRAVKSIPKFVEALTSGAEFALEAGDMLSWDYARAWERAKAIRFYGRYISIKLLETLRRMALLNAQLEDVRPAGGWSPRLTLSYIYPEHNDLLNSGSNIQSVLDTINRLAAQTKAHAGSYTRLDYFNLEVLLCNYRQAIERKYPGRPHDSELQYFCRAEAYWGDSIDWEPFFASRAALFPHSCLGELNGWEGVRDECDKVYQDHGYFWSDVEYDFHATRKSGNWMRPVRQD